MARIEWQNSLATGIDSIDQQHQQIIKLCNRLEELVECNSSRDEVSAILRDICDCIKSHFAYEEQLLEQSGFKFAESHIRCHRRFAARLESLKQRFDAGACVMYELLNFLQRCVTTHMMSQDQQYVADVQRVLE